MKTNWANQEKGFSQSSLCPDNLQIKQCITECLYLPAEKRTSCIPLVTLLRLYACLCLYSNAFSSQYHGLSCGLWMWHFLIRGSRGGGQGVWTLPTPKTHKRKVFFARLVRIPWKSQRYQANIQYWAIIGTPVKYNLNGVSLAVWW